LLHRAGAGPATSTLLSAITARSFIFHARSTDGCWYKALHGGVRGQITKSLSVVDSRSQSLMCSKAFTLMSSQSRVRAGVLRTSANPSACGACGSSRGSAAEAPGSKVREACTSSQHAVHQARSKGVFMPQLPVIPAPSTACSPQPQQLLEMLIVCLDWCLKRAQLSLQL
jgi:hypothetical protein